MSEYSENDETMTEDEEVLADEVAEDEELDEDVIEDEADEDEEDAEDEDDEPEAIDYNDTLFDKCQRAARLLRNRKDMIRDEESEKNERVSNLVRAVKLLELKPQMEQKEMAELLGVRLRELDAMMAEAEKNGIVSRVMPEEEDMRAILVSAEDGAAEAAAAQGREGVKLVPGLSDEELDEIFAVLDKIIDPLTKMGLDNDDRRGGFGGRGIEGMILAAQYAREHRLPYFGICLGMQVAVIEFARHAAGIADADSGEFNEICKHKVIDFMPGQSDEIDKGGTLRLGACPCVITPGTTMARCYGTLEISERHRHRYEFNNDYRLPLTDAGLTLSGLSPDGRLVETVELSDRAFFVGVQYHPEFKSRPNKAHPLFRGFIAAALDEAKKR